MTTSECQRPDGPKDLRYPTREEIYDFMGEYPAELIGKLVNLDNLTIEACREIVNNIHCSLFEQSESCIVCKALAFLAARDAGNENV